MNSALVEVSRGGLVESLHCGTAAVVDVRGGVLWAIGSADAAVFPRSTVKPLQALPLVASGAADRFGLADAELAIACGSHGGTPDDVAMVKSVLAKAAIDPSLMACGVHWPLDERASRGLAARGEQPSPLHNNCSGKHAGVLCVARMRGIDHRDYFRPEHAVMKEITAALEEVCHARLSTTEPGIDGCSMPTFPLSLVSLAAGFARFGTGDGLPGDLAEAAARLRHAMHACPARIADSRGLDSQIIRASKGVVLVKSGAEGTACAAIPERGLGIAVKIDDGAGRAAQVAMAAILRSLAHGLLDADAQAVLDNCASPVLKNWNGVEIGMIRASDGLRRALDDCPSRP